MENGRVNAYLDVIDGVDVLHAVFDDPPKLLKSLVTTHGADGVSLDENITSSQKLERLECTAVGAQNSLATLRKLGAVAHHAVDFDDIHGSAIFKNLDGLGHRNRTSKQADQVARLEDRRGIVCFPRRLDRHGTLNQIQLTGNKLLLKRVRDQRPRLAQVGLAVFGKFDLEVRLGCERATFRVFGLELLNLRERVSTVEFRDC